MGFGVAGGSKTLAWVFAMAPHRLRVLVAYYYPHAFLKRGKGILLSPPSVCLSVRPSVRYATS